MFTKRKFYSSSSVEDLSEEVKSVDQLYSYNVITLTIVIQIQEMKSMIKEMNECIKGIYRMMKKGSGSSGHIMV